MQRIVSRFSGIGEIIFDPFAGSGTTGVAAVLEGRRRPVAELADLLGARWGGWRGLGGGGRGGGRGGFRLLRGGGRGDRGLRTERRLRYSQSRKAGGIAILTRNNFSE